jgi:hypothetical protein
LSREEQAQRDLLVQRVMLVEEIRKIKQRIIAYLKREDVYLSFPKTSDNFSRARRDAIRSVKFDSDDDDDDGGRKN